MAARAKYPGDQIAPNSHHPRAGQRDRAAPQQQHELIATHACGKVARACVRPEHVGKPAQHLVARTMTDAVIDLLEAVQIHEDQTGRQGVSLRDRLRELCEQDSAVG